MSGKKLENHPIVVILGIMAALATILGFFYAINANPPNPPSSQATSPQAIPDSMKLRIHVIDSENKPINHVAVSIFSSSPPDLDYTDTNGNVEFPVLLKSSQVRLSLLKEGYETSTINTIDLSAYRDRSKQITLKKK